MRKISALAALVLCVGSALAVEYSNVDASLQKALGHGSLKAAQMQSGVLRVVLTKPELSELAYYTYVYHDICAHQWRQPQVFAQWKLQRVEVFNATTSQGFAFDARGSVCADMGQMGQNYRTLIAQRTQACTTGTCPAM